MPSSAVLVPLYVYPFPGAWTPLYEAITANPSTRFLVVINPGNGPGPSPLPDANYCHEIPKLRSHPNVTVYGYVYVNWARRDLQDVRRDVEMYAAWPEHASKPASASSLPSSATSSAEHSDTALLAVDGIFVDETPVQPGVEGHSVAFLGSLTSLVHRIWPPAQASIGTSGTPVSLHTPSVIHNPGCMPPPELLALADLCVVFEDTHEMFRQRLREGVFDLPRSLAGPGVVEGMSGNGEYRAAGDDNEHEAGGQVGGVQGEGNDRVLEGRVKEGERDPVVKLRVLRERERQRRCVVVHSVPLPPAEEGEGAAEDGNGLATQKRQEEEVFDLVSAAKGVAGAVFLTELESLYYESFGRGWREWAGVIGRD